MDLAQPSSVTGVITNEDVLPTYSANDSGSRPAVPLSTHVFGLRDSYGNPEKSSWFTLTLTSRAPSPSQLPRIIGDEPITGSVSLNLGRGARIKSVAVVVSLDIVMIVRLFTTSQVLGEMILTGTDRFRFTRVIRRLWAQENGYPTIAGETQSDGRPHEFKGKLHGDFSWPFSVSLPRTVKLEHGEFSQYSLPGTFVEKSIYSRMSIVYRMLAVVTRGLFTTEHM